MEANFLGISTSYAAYSSSDGDGGGGGGVLNVKSLLCTSAQGRNFQGFQPDNYRFFNDVN